MGALRYIIGIILMLASIAGFSEGDYMFASFVFMIGLLLFSSQNKETSPRDAKTKVHYNFSYGSHPHKEIITQDTETATSCKSEEIESFFKSLQKEEEKNRKINKIRAPGERPFSVIKTVFNNSRTQIKTIARVTIKEMFKCFAYNLYQLVTLTRMKLAKAL